MGPYLLAMLFGPLGATELLVIILVVLLFFVGGKKIPELARGLGRGISEFKQGLKDAPTSKESGTASPQAHTDKVAESPKPKEPPESR